MHICQPSSACRLSNEMPVVRTGLAQSLQIEVLRMFRIMGSSQPTLEAGNHTRHNHDKWC